MDAAELLIQQINEEIRGVEENLCAGSAKDYSEYQHLCGKVRGLLLAREKVSDLKQRMENFDE
jgi:hypothetical protein